MNSIDSQLNRLAELGIDECAIEGNLIEAIYSTLLDQIFGEVMYKYTKQGELYTPSIADCILRSNITTKDKLETIDKLFTEYDGNKQKIDAGESCKVQEDRNVQDSKHSGRCRVLKKVLGWVHDVCKIR